MSTSESCVVRRQFGPPKVPQTPSPSVNELLEKYCQESTENPIKAAAMYFACFIFQGIMMLYNVLGGNKGASQPLWLGSCGVICFGLIVEGYIVYHLLLLSMALLEFVLYYVLIAITLAGVVMGVLGAAYYVKDSSKQGSTPGQGSNMGDSDPSTNDMSEQPKDKYY